MRSFCFGPILVDICAMIVNIYEGVKVPHNKGDPTLV
jgi:hypothetical protein